MKWAANPALIDGDTLIWFLLPSMLAVKRCAAWGAALSVCAPLAVKVAATDTAPGQRHDLVMGGFDQAN